MSTAIKNCSICGFEGFVYARKVHCPTCKTKNSLTNNHDALIKTKERVCECGCGSTVISPKRFISGHNMSRRKDFIYKNGRCYANVNCDECGIEFERREDQINKRNGFNYCSIKCASKANGRKTVGRILVAARKGKYIHCQQCSKEFYASLGRLKQNVKFCSLKCRDEWNKEQPVPKGFITKTDNRGEKNGRYKHGKRVGTNVNKPKVRESVISRDGNWCLLCGKPGPGLHLHRIVYGSQGGKYEVDNCVQLCAVHHEEVHSNKKKWVPILYSRVSANTAIKIPQ